MTVLRTLYCALGDHDWEAPVKRGRKPLNCPDHRPATPTAAPEKEHVGYARIIEEALADPRAVDCHCAFTDGMTFDDLVTLGGGCTMPSFCCPTLDRIRRRIGFRVEPIYDDI